MQGLIRKQKLSLFADNSPNTSNETKDNDHTLHSGWLRMDSSINWAAKLTSHIRIK